MRKTTSQQSVNRSLSENSTDDTGKTRLDQLATYEGTKDRPILHKVGHE